MLLLPFELILQLQKHMIYHMNIFLWDMVIFRGANQFQKEVGQNRAGQAISGVYQRTTPKNLYLKGYFCLEFSGWGRKSGSAFALVDLVSLAPLYESVYFFI